MDLIFITFALFIVKQFADSLELHEILSISKHYDKASSEKLIDVYLAAVEFQGRNRYKAYREISEYFLSNSCSVKTDLAEFQKASMERYLDLIINKVNKKGYPKYFALLKKLSHSSALPAPIVSAAELLGIDLLLEASGDLINYYPFTYFWCVRPIICLNVTSQLKGLFVFASWSVFLLPILYQCCFLKRNGLLFKKIFKS